MKALKGLLIYIGIVLGIILGIGLILLCIMYFVPSFRLFGLGVVHYGETTEEEVITLSDYTDYSNVVLSVGSNKIGINVVPVETENISYDMDLNIFGISTEIIEYKIVKQLQVTEGTLQIFLNITEPNGWISTSDSSITIKVPSTLNIGLVTSTTSGQITIGSSDLTMNIRSLTASTGKGNLTLLGLGEGDDEKTLNLESLNLTTDNGRFDLTSIDNLYVDNKVKLVADDGEFDFKNLFASVEITGNGVEINADKIESGENGFSCITQSGFIYIDTLTLKYIESAETYVSAENTIIAENLDLEIREIIGKTAIVTTYGDVDIEILNDYGYIEDSEGDVEIGVAKDTIIITTTMGDINVASYYAIGEFTSDKGDINVNSRGEYSKGIYTKIYNIDGDVNIYNRANQLILKTDGRSNVTVDFVEILTFSSVYDVFQNKIETSTQGKCIVHLPTVGVPHFKFIAKGVISGDYRAYEDYQYAPSAPETDSQIQTISCTVYFYFEGRIAILGYTPTD